MEFGSGFGVSGMYFASALVDGIHTYDFVMRQSELLHARMRAAGLILLDDIDFWRPGARMRETWEDVAANSRVGAAVEVNRHVGLVQV